MFSFHQVVSVIFVVDEFILRASQRHIFTCLTTWCVPIDLFSQPPMRWGCRTFSWYFWFRRKNKMYGEMPTRHKNSKHSLYRWWMLWSIPRLIIFGVCVIFAIDKYILHAPQSQITLEVKKVRPLSSLLMEIFSTHDGGIHQPLTKGFVASIFVNDGCILHTSRRRIRPRI